MNFMHRPSGSRLIIRQSSLKSTLIPRPGHPGCKMCQITTVVGLQVFRNEPGEEIQTPYVLCAGKYIILGVFEVRNLRSQIVTSRLYLILQDSIIKLCRKIIYLLFLMK